MFRSTRRFIQDRQPHTDFVVSTMRVLAQDPPQRCYDIVDGIGREVRRSELWRACAGWRVYPYDPVRDRTRFEPWWFIIRPHSEGLEAWDIDPTDQPCEYVMDQALAVYRRHQLESRVGSVRPCDLILHQDQWWLDDQGYLVTVPRLDRAGLFLRERQAEPVIFQVVV